jgi:hypothetical protein
MNREAAQKLLDEIIEAVFGYENPLDLDAAEAKFTTGLRLPQLVNDSTTGQPTWAMDKEYDHFITLENANVKDWSTSERDLRDLNDAMAAWSKINHITTERQLNSRGIFESDSVFDCENIYHSCSLRDCKNVLFSENSSDCDHLLAGLRATNCNTCVRVEDSDQCEDSYGVIWSANIKRSLFIQDCKDLEDCMLCSHISSKRFCVANVQLDEARYNQLRDEVAAWILTS